MLRLFFPILRHVALFVHSVFIVLGFALVISHAAEAQSVREGEEAFEAGNYDQARRIFEPLAEDGSIYAQYRMGYLHQSGRGLPKDDEAALAWYQRVLDQDMDDIPEDATYDPVARTYNNVAVLYDTDGSVPRDCERAYEYYRSSAQRGLPEGQYGMATMLMRGTCFDDTLDDLAVRLYQEAAGAGLAAAQHQMGLHYCTGRGVEQSSSTAAVWWREAATQGYRPAQIYLADRYMRGKGLPQDDVQAYVWASRAILNTSCGGADASEDLQDALIELEDRMDEEQHARANAMLQETLPTSEDTPVGSPLSGE